MQSHNTGHAVRIYFVKTVLFLITKHFQSVSVFLDDKDKFDLSDTSLVWCYLFLQLCDKKQWTGRLFLLLSQGLRRWDYLPNPSLSPIPTVCFHHVSSPGHCTPSRPEPEGGHGPHWWARGQRFVAWGLFPSDNWEVRLGKSNFQKYDFFQFQFPT